MHHDTAVWMVRAGLITKEQARRLVRFRAGKVRIRDRDLAGWPGAFEGAALACVRAESLWKGYS